MSRPQEIRAGEGPASVSIEYVKGRKTLRFRAAERPGERAVEISFPQLIERLDIDPGQFGAPARYLLFGGLHHRARGGAGDVVGVFESESVARRAFHELRRRPTSQGGWAELTAIDTRGRITRLGWFGMDQARWTRPRISPTWFGTLRPLRGRRGSDLGVQLP